MYSAFVGCRVKGDKYAMVDHICSGSLKRKKKGSRKLGKIAEGNESGRGLLDKRESKK